MSFLKNYSILAISLLISIELFLYMFVLIYFCFKVVITNLLNLDKLFLKIVEYIDLYNFFILMFSLFLNIITVIFFIAIFFSVYSINICGIIPFLIYIKYVCNAKTLACLFYFIPINVDIKLVLLIAIFAISLNVYDFIYGYYIIAFNYINTNAQFKEKNIIVRYEVANTFVKINAIDMLTSHHILLSDSDDLVNLYDKKHRTFIYINYYNEIIDKPYLVSDMIMISVIEVLNIILFTMIIKIFKRIMLSKMYINRMHRYK